MNNTYSDFQLGHAEVDLTSETDDKGKLWDTKVEIGPNLICFISGEEIEKFKEELQAVINKYRI